MLLEPHDDLGPRELTARKSMPLAKQETPPAWASRNAGRTSAFGLTPGSAPYRKGWRCSHTTRRRNYVIQSTGGFDTGTACICHAQQLSHRHDLMLLVSWTDLRCATATSRPDHALQCVVVVPDAR